jgi:hypothetical protein
MKDVLHGPRKARTGEGLEQVVDRVNFEGAKRECVVGGDKDDRGSELRLQLIEHLEAIHLRHLHIKKGQGWAGAPNLRQRLSTIRALCHDVYLLEFAQQAADSLSRQRLVVGDQGRHAIHGLPPSAEAPER